MAAVSFNLSYTTSSSGESEDDDNQSDAEESGEEIKHNLQPPRRRGQKEFDLDISPKYVDVKPVERTKQKWLSSLTQLNKAASATTPTKLDLTHLKKREHKLFGQYTKDDKFLDEVSDEVQSRSRQDVSTDSSDEDSFTDRINRRAKFLDKNRGGKKLVGWKFTGADSEEYDKQRRRDANHEELDEAIGKMNNDFWSSKLAKH